MRSPQTFSDDNLRLYQQSLHGINIDVLDVYRRLKTMEQTIDDIENKATRSETTAEIKEVDKKAGALRDELNSFTLTAFAQSDKYIQLQNLKNYRIKNFEQPLVAFCRDLLKRKKDR